MKEKEMNFNITRTIFRLAAILMLLLSARPAFSQAKKPTLMVVPSEAFCMTNGYKKSYADPSGQTVEQPDYRAALQNDPDLLLVIGKINTIMANRGFPLKNLETEIKKLTSENAEAHMLSSMTGSGIDESPVEALKRVAKADILIQITYTINEQGPNRSVTFNMQGIDAYTGKQIAGAQGTGEQSFSADVPTLLEEAVLANIENFTRQLQDYFDDIFENGREVVVKIKFWKNSPVSFHTEFLYAGEKAELSTIIDDWFADHTVKGRYSITDLSKRMMNVEQVRIPLYYERNGRKRAMDTRSFVNELRKFLREEPFWIESKVYYRGLGEAWLIIGDK